MEPDHFSIRKRSTLLLKPARRISRYTLWTRFLSLFLAGIFILPACTTNIGLTPADIITETPLQEQPIRPPIFSPYVLIGSFNAQEALSAHLQYVTLGFVQHEGLCNPVWTGSYNLANVLDEVQKFELSGGHIIVSFGGAGSNGAQSTDIAFPCGDDLPTLEDGYLSVINQFGAVGIDFDIEVGKDLADKKSIENRNLAINYLVDTKKSLLVSYTLPAGENGLGSDALNLINNAHEINAQISTVNIMTMDYGWANDHMGQSAITAAKSLFKQLKGIYKERTDRGIWQMIGITPMIGANDHPWYLPISETFTQDNAKEVKSFVDNNQIGFLSFWALPRDKSCANNKAEVSPDCSGIVQKPLEFTCIFLGCDLSLGLVSGTTTPTLMTTPTLGGTPGATTPTIMTTPTLGGTSSGITPTIKLTTPTVVRTNSAMTHNMTTARKYLAVALANGYIYAVGGRNESSRLSSVEYAPILPDGSLGTWHLTSTMNAVRGFPSAVAINGTLYAIGGDEAAGKALSSVESAVINADGSLGTWHFTSPLITARFALSIVATNGYLYAIGGATAGNTPLASVERAAIHPDGSLGNWEETAPMNIVRIGHAAVVANNRLYALGGLNQSSALSSVEWTTVNSDGTLGKWNLTNPLISAREFLAAVIIGNAIYAIGGNYMDSVLSSVELAGIQDDGSLTPWQNTTPLSMPRTGFGAVASGDIYLIGGKSDVAMDSIERIILSKTQSQTGK